jgi:uncharacterized membrane protein YbhN (UPF0104 family)
MAERTVTAMLTRMRATVRSRRLAVTVRIVIGLGVLGAVVAIVGTGPIVHGILSVDGRSIGAAIVLAAIATAAAAWRWCVIAGRLGVRLTWRIAFGRYYQSQFLNSVIPGGIVGDVHRAIGDRLTATDIVRSARAVVLERTVGQLVQVSVSLTMFAVIGTQFQGYLSSVVAIGLGLVTVALAVVAASSVRARHVMRREYRQIREALGTIRASVQVVIASLVVIACHVATFAIATATVGLTVTPTGMIVLALVVLLGASIPFNIGGWGPREGVAGWAFAAAGLGSAAGVAVSTSFGVVTFVSVLPGAIAMVVFAAQRRRGELADPTVSLPPRELEKAR